MQRVRLERGSATTRLGRHRGQHDVAPAVAVEPASDGHGHGAKGKDGESVFTRDRECAHLYTHRGFFFFKCEKIGS